MTAVFKVSESGTLQGFQVGPADVLATLSAGNSVWGWIGGLDGISSIFRYCHNLSATFKAAAFKDFSPPKHLPASCKILAFDRICTYQDDTSESFDGDFNAQMVGFTICALSHELQLEPAIELFMHHLIPSLLGLEQASFPGLREALHTQLLDNGKKILNQGAARGLPERFCQALEKSCISMGAIEPVVYWKGWRSELYMVGGLLKWIGRCQRDAYFTRSAVVARTAIYMKEAGYTIGTIRTWNGVGKRPTATRGVILVTGGVNLVDHNNLTTDEYMADDDGPLQFPHPKFISHYRFSTFGAMLVNTLQAKPDDPPEIFQDYLHKVHTNLSAKLKFTWAMHGEDPEIAESEKEVWAIPLWQRDTSRNSSIAVRLSSIYFAEVAVLIAPFYECIAFPDTLQVALAEQDRSDRTLGLKPALVKFRAITASIILSVVANIAGRDFESIRHATSMSLHSPKSLQSTSTEVARLLKQGLSFSRVAILISYLHCGTRPPRGPESMQDEEAIYLDSGIIGWRSGRFAVLPALLFSMSAGPSSSILGFQCTDSFIGNVPVYPDGSVKSNKHGRLLESFDDFRPLQDLMRQDQEDRTESQIIQASHKISLGSPTFQPPDAPLHLAIERPLDRSDPDLSLCGRVNGEPIGTVGVLAILRNLVRSGCAEITKQSLNREVTVHESLHTQGIQFFNVSPSVWGRSRRKPTGGKMFHTYIPVGGDAAWALFLLGECEARVVLRGCARCVVKGWMGENRMLVVVGFT